LLPTANQIILDRAVNGIANEIGAKPAEDRRSGLAGARARS